MAVTITNDAGTTRTNLGLGDAATKTVGTGASNIPLNSNLGDAATKTVGTSAGNIPILDSSGDLAASTYTNTDTVYTHPTTAGNKHIPTAGAADQVLTYSASGTATWADAAGGGKLLQTYTFENGSRSSANSASTWNQVFGGTFNKISSTSKIILHVITSGFGEHQHGAKQKFTLGTGTSNQTVCTFPHGSVVATALPGQLIITGNTQTGNLSWDYYWMRRPCTIINPNSTDSAEVGTQTYSTVTIWEVEV